MTHPDDLSHHLPGNRHPNLLDSIHHGCYPKNLKKRIVIAQREQTHRQCQWMTQLAFHARDLCGADWVISNDADEFWIPEGGDLKHGLNRAGSLITCHRFNMLLTEDCRRPDCRYFTSEYHVSHPIDYGKTAQQSEQYRCTARDEVITKALNISSSGGARLSSG
jgi:hypothetical protein